MDSIDLQEIGRVEFREDNPGVSFRVIEAWYVNPQGEILVGTVRASIINDGAVANLWRRAIGDGVKALVARGIKQGKVIVKPNSSANN